MTQFTIAEGKEKFFLCFNFIMIIVYFGGTGVYGLKKVRNARCLIQMLNLNYRTYIWAKK